MTQRMVNPSKVILSYGSLVAEYGRIQTKLQKEKIKVKWLTNERNIQDKIISQLKKLLSCSSQAKNSCTLGHYQCNIDHLKYNIFRHYSNSQKCARKKIKIENPVVKTHHWSKNKSFGNLTKKIDELQSCYGVPPRVSKMKKRAHRSEPDQYFITSNIDRD